ncbi:VOC family protein [Pontibacter ruber]|uniref:VOC family protein n=1 Tax=Pontibacter ruber TaxID=1343895 RepID=A0ABW5CT81_9BACT|nr:VOC family protein [Pontibacter ruber]
MQKTTTFLMFVGNQCGKAAEAIQFYTSLFTDSEVKHIECFKSGEPGGREGDIKHALFTLAGQEYMISENPMDHKFSFTPAMSIYVNCDSDAEIDALFQQLSEGGAALMPLGDYGFSKKFGWLTDKYGVSWQLNFNV